MTEAQLQANLAHAIIHAVIDDESVLEAIDAFAGIGLRVTDLLLNGQAITVPISDQPRNPLANGPQETEKDDAFLRGLRIVPDLAFIDGGRSS